MKRRLTDALPLRAATDLPQYRSDAWLPWAYGRVTLAPVPLDAAGLEWLVADHPIAAVDAVTDGGAPVTGWTLVQRVDALGRPIATIRLTQAPKGALAVQLAGRRHAVTGATLEHPADIAADLLTQAGWSVPANAFQGLRDDYPGLALGIVFDSPVRLREAIAAVIEPLGAHWTARNFAARRAGARTPSDTLTPVSADTIRAVASDSELATAARVAFAHDWATNSPRQTLLLEAPDAIRRYGRIETTLALPAVRTARDALAIGSARLADLARPRWNIEATASAGLLDVAVGGTLALAHPWVPAGAAEVLGMEHDRNAGALALQLSMPAGPAPAVVMASRGAAIDPANRNDTIVYKDGIATFTITDDNGNPLANAAVTLDSIDTKQTDRAGRVQFKTERGPHTLSVFLAGYAPFEMDVTV